MNRTEYTDQVSGDSAAPKSELVVQIRRLLKPLASLQLTVVLFALGMVLVFFGTLAQMNEGIEIVVDKYFQSFGVKIPLQLIVQFGQKFFAVPETAHLDGWFPFIGGWVLGSLLLVNLLAAHALRFKLSWKRTGIFLIHTGMIVLLLGELFAGLSKTEGKMIIYTGSSSNYVYDLREAEFAVTKNLSGNKQEAVVVPASFLRKGSLIQHNDLPFDIQVDSYFLNSSSLHRLEPGEKAAVTDGYGTKYTLEERPVVSGADPDQKVNMPATIVTLKEKNADKVLGVYLSTAWPETGPQDVTVDGQVYQIELRLKRIYKPYSVYLSKVETRNYPGSNIPKEFTSSIRLTDHETGQVREVDIYMNHPLRHRGETFYQADVVGKDEGTGLQVVNNPVWIMPYAACVMMALGMMIHFSLALITFLGRLRTSQPRESRGTFERFAPHIVVGLSVLYLLSKAMPPSPGNGEMDLYHAGLIPIQDSGRIKPMDTIARVDLTIFSNKQEFVAYKDDVPSSMSWLPIADFGKPRRSAMQWYLELASVDPMVPGIKDVDKHRIFRIDNDQVLNELKLEARPGSYRYSREELNNYVTKIGEAATKARAIAENKQTPFDVDIVRLEDRLDRYMAIRQSFRPAIEPMANDKPWLSLAQVDNLNTKPLQKEMMANTIRQMLTRFSKQLGMDPEEIAALSSDRLIELGAVLAEQNPEVADGLDRKFRRQVRDKAEELRPQMSPQAEAYAHILRCYRNGDAEQFNTAVREYHENYSSKLPDSQWFKIKLEGVFNHFSPLYYCGVFYIFVFLLTCVSWLKWTEPLQRTAYALAIFTFVVHTLALVARMYLQGRPPVTNLYSSAVFIAWGCVALCLVLEYVFWFGLGNAVGAILGFASIRIAYFLSDNADHDTMESLRAVLDTNPWLATHVTTVTFGYVATFVAGFIATIYIGWGVLLSNLDEKKEKIIGQMIYGVLCFATLLSFTGTVLGGIWADQSWGRFWGWDPKENGAVLIVIWNALILHARWCGLVKVRGMAVLAVVGNMVTAWSWFGTNQLGVGLHAYGFNKQLAMACRIYWLKQLAIIGIALLPRHYWRSYAARGKPLSITPSSKPKPGIS